MKANRRKSTPRAPDHLFDESLGSVIKKLVGAPAKKFLKELPQKAFVEPSVDFVQAAMGGNQAPRHFDPADRE